MPNLQFVAVVGSLLAFAACSTDDGGISDLSSASASTTSTSVSGPTTTASATTAVPETTTAPTTTAAMTTTISVTTTIAAPGQAAVWPAGDVVFDTPEEAAADFVLNVLGVRPVLGPFQQGDSHSGEIVVFSPGDGDPATSSPRGLLAMRRLPPADGWFVIAGISEGVSITSPEAGSVTSAGMVEVNGLGRGFEANLVVRAITAGNADDLIDLEFTMTDWTTPVPYSVVLDIRAANPGDAIAIVAVGDTGLESDPSEFAAIPIIVGE